MKIVLVNSVINENDAIGNDIIKQFECLRNNGFKVFLYSEFVCEKHKEHLLSWIEFNQLIRDTDNLIIYHHGTYWNIGEEILAYAQCKIYFRYHNVTPSCFFEQYSYIHSEACKAGRLQAENFVRSNKVCKFLPASTYNGNELIAYGANANDVTVIPPFHMLHDFDSSILNRELANELPEGKINLLFVGRVSPNKGHQHLIETVRTYIDLYDANINLNIVGGVDADLVEYYDDLVAIVKFYHLDEVVHFRQKVDFKDLHTFYTCSDIFLLMSEHEGFCVPILEAQYHKLPVLALARCAVKETLGVNQLTIDQCDYVSFASAIYVIGNNNMYQKYLVENGNNNLGRFNASRLTSKLIEAINMKN